MPASTNGAAAQDGRTPATVAPTEAQPKSVRPARRLWEYKVETHSADPAELERTLNERGAAGWRLAALHYAEPQTTGRGTARRTEPATCCAVFERRRRPVAALSPEAAALEREVAVPGYMECTHAYARTPRHCACSPSCACHREGGTCHAPASAPATARRR